jgi:leucyl/phenylalanyl-tRNA---protein transferase
MKLTVLDPLNADQAFPPLNKALIHPNGLLAVGGCLSNNRLINAYRHGVFPWYNQGEPILWWSPDPRLVLFPDQLVVSRSLHKLLKKKLFTITCDQAFSRVIEACAKPRKEEAGTWISQEINQAYNSLHRQGVAHSAETWLDGELVGGLYGLALGRVFFGESMFYTKPDASKVAFVTLVEHLKSWNYKMVDCQVHTSHLARFGAKEIDRSGFAKLLDEYCDSPASQLSWQFE